MTALGILGARTAGGLSAALPIAAAAFLLTLALTPPLASWLRAHQFGKAIRVDGPDHAEKTGTPTMGGLAAVVSILLAGLYLSLRYDSTAPLVLVAVVVYGALGLADDLAGLARRSAARELGVGLTARHLLAAQTLAAVALALTVPRFIPDGMSSPPVLLSIVAILGTVNGVNFSDGLDGLAAGLSVLAFGAFALVLAGGLHPDPVAAALSLAIAAACAGFLVYNRHPAMVFMGNVTSYSLGAALAILALAAGHWWLLPVIGAVFVVEVASVVLQVGVFKLSGGRRILRMAPLHHHFELGGHAETTIVHRFWLAGLAASSLGIVLGLTLSERFWPMGP